MITRKAREGFYQQSWGHWKYFKDNDTLRWNREGEDDYEIWFENSEQVSDVINQALHWLAQVKRTRSERERDMEHLSKALSELVGCPRLADAYAYTSYGHEDEFWNKVKTDNYSTCMTCDNRYSCTTSY